MRNLSAFVTASVILAASAVAAEDKVKIILPMDPAKAVITMDYVGGLRRAPQPKIGPGGVAIFETPKPYLVVRADGAVLRAGKPVDDKKMTADELRELLKFIVIDNEFFEFSPAKVDAAIEAKEREFRRLQDERRKQGGPVQIARSPVDLPADMATTQITVELGDKKSTAKTYGYAILARRHEEIEPIQQMSRIEQKLRSLAK